MTTDEVWAMEWELNPVIEGRKAGVYIITTKGTKDILYIGRSGNLLNRLRIHPVYKKKLHDIYIRVMDVREEINRLEHSMIYYLTPPLNNNLYGPVERNRNYQPKEEEPREPYEPNDPMDSEYIAYMRKCHRQVFG